MNGNALYSKNKRVRKKFLSTFFLGPKFGPPTLATSIFVIDLTVIGTQLTFNSFTLPFPFSLSLLNPFRKFSLEILEPVWPIKFGHLISIPHHSSFNFSHPFAFITPFPSLTIFHTIWRAHVCHSAAFFFFFPLSSSFFFPPGLAVRSGFFFFFFFSLSLVSLGTKEKKKNRIEQNKPN